MTLQERLEMQEQGLYINEISKGEVDDMTQEDIKGNVVPFRPNENITIDLVPSFAITIGEAKARIELLQEFVKEMMVEGLDFGFIPGCGAKPSLLKPGAEKLCDIFGLAKYIKVTNRLEDWEKGLFSYEVKAVLINKRTGLIEAEGIGSCNSKENKYKLQDPYSIVNTILKMAKKRALVDATLSVTRSSGLFTQDVEDIEIVKDSPKSTTHFVSNNTPTKMATEKQLNKMYFMTKQMNMPGTTARQLLKDRYNADSSDQLTSKQASDFINHLTELQG